MSPPFTSEQFLDVFRRYNEGVWPVQYALVGLALFIAFAAHRANAHKSWRWGRIALAGLAALWLWSGIVYHQHFFSALTPAGQIFGVFFIAEAGLLLISAWQDGSWFDRAPRASLIAGATAIAFALVLYPAIGVLLGQRYPRLPTFGTPCPTTIFTFGIFCLLPSSIPRFALVIPLLWSVVASFAAVNLGVREDFGLPVFALAALVAVHNARRPVIWRSRWSSR